MTATFLENDHEYGRMNILMCATWKREMNMAAKSIHKVVRLQLAWLYDEQNHFRYPYQKLHDLQQMVNQVKNRTIQAFWEWSNM